MNKSSIVHIIFFAIVITIAAVAIYKPDFNYDILPYVASAYSLESKDTNDVHNFAYEIVRRTAGDKKFESLVKGNQFREAMDSCVRCFYQQLPFYKVRPLYVVLIYALYKAGFNIAYSTVIISSVSYAVICVICFFWLKHYTGNTLLLSVLSSLLALSPYLLGAASESSPNSLSAMILITALFYLLVKQKLFPFLVLMLLSVFARPDNIILLILSGLALTIYGEKRRTLLTGSLILGVVSFFLIDKWSGNYSWSITFEHTFKNWISTPAEYEPHFTLGTYASGLTKWASLLKYSVMAVQMLILVLTIYLKTSHVKDFKKNLELLFLFALGISILLHILIFPSVNDRYFITQYLIIDLLFIKSIMSEQKQLREFSKEE